VRTSTGTFFDKDFDEVISAVEDRVSLVTMLPKANQEGLQVLKYVDGQKYEPHHGEEQDGDVTNDGDCTDTQYHQYKYHIIIHICTTVRHRDCYMLGWVPAHGCGTILSCATVTWHDGEGTC
jgi:hypothetical protein